MQLRFWDAWGAGASVLDAAAAAGVTGRTAGRWIVAAGGVRPRWVLLDGLDEGPRPRCLTLPEREVIALRRAAGLSVRAIARELDRAPSTISREVRLNGSIRPGYYQRKLKPIEYSAVMAQCRAEERRARPKLRKLVKTPELARHVQTRLQQRWSPRQISQTLPADFPDDPEMRVSHETIYRSLFVQGRGGLRRELHQHLRTGRAMRKPQAGTRRPAGPSGAISISQRPAEAADRAVPGHWEGDLIIGAHGRSAIGTLVERSTRYCLLLHLPDGHSPVQVRDAMVETIATLPAHLWRSLTWDRGTEMSRHHEITIATGLPIYFCDPRSPWQRGSNENTNGLLRQYFPKGTDLSGHSADHLAAVAVELNGRPRETLGWRSPAQALNELLSTPFNQPGVATTE